MNLPKPIKSGWRKIISYVIPFGALLYVAATQVANAQFLPAGLTERGAEYVASGAENTIGDLAYSAIGKLVFGLNYIIATIAGIGIAVEAWLIGAVLNISTTVFASPVIQQGFTVTLSIANLGFVLGIIIIALATILHRETYGYKKILWKLIVAAILVNFSLVIVSPIFNFSNSITQYFLNCVDPSAGGCSGSGTGANSMNDFAVHLAGAFNPQKSLLSINNLDASGTLGANPNLTFTGAFAATGQDLGKLIVPIFSIFFVAFELLIIVVVLAVLFVQLLIRYVYISILAIIMPFAWLGWVFPSMKRWWSQWWDKFIKQSFFAPIVVFFLYLSIQTATFMSSAGATGAQSFATYSSTSSNVIWASLANLLTNFFSPIVQNFMNIILLAGLSIGGMMVADKMSIHLAGAAVSTVKSAAKGVQNYAGKQTKKVGRKAVPNKLKESLQSGKYRVIPKRLQVAAGVGLERVQRAGGGDLVAQEAKTAEELAKSPQQFARVLSTKAGSLGRGGMTAERQMAMMAQLAKDEDLQKEVAKQGNIIGGKEMQQFLKDNEKTFKDRHQDKTYESLKDKSGLTLLELSETAKGPLEKVLRFGQLANIEEKMKRKAELDAKATAVGLNTTEEEERSNILKRKAELDAKATAVGLNTTEERELKAWKAADAGKALFTDAEREEFKEAKDKYDDNINKLKKLGAKNPDVIGDAFQDHDKARAKLIAEGKPVPLTFEPEAVKNMQKAVLTAMAEGFSPQNARGLIDAIGKKNNLKYFAKSMDDLEARDPQTAAQIRALAKSNTALANWIRTSPGGRIVVDLNKMFGIEKERKSKENQGGNHNP